MSFTKVAASPEHERWPEMIHRQAKMYNRSNDIRSYFWRDYNRILHCTAYRRLKHKTQVFFATRNDHICTRMEHVNHVAAVSSTLCNTLGLNVELAMAIATGHDLGHAPFGHWGEHILKDIVKGFSKDEFWHEKNSLKFVDKLETLPDPYGKEYNLFLTYAVRDGIISHCGEVDNAYDEPIRPRNENILLENIVAPNQYQPFTWEGCIVKVADKIAYLGRDIEDAFTLGVLNFMKLRELTRILSSLLEKKIKLEQINTTFLMHELMIDLCENSTPEKGITFSKKYVDLINEVKKFNYKHIYMHTRLDPFKNYATLIIKSFYEFLLELYDSTNTLQRLDKEKDSFPLTVGYFIDWLEKYTHVPGSRRSRFANEKIYNLGNEYDYKQAIVDYISGMTDAFAIRAFNELINF
ncbi:MAG: HD domain-containing protein [Epulopiscium sp.]|nr:HD domain-containing protein [Candidatus Epulonipiscium sp.]